MSSLGGPGIVVPLAAVSSTCNYANSHPASPLHYTPDSIAISKAAEQAGWNVERLSSWRVPPWLKGRDLVFYGEPLFAAVVADALGLRLVEPSFEWMVSLPELYRRRSVKLTTLLENGEINSQASFSCEWIPKRASEAPSGGPQTLGTTRPIRCRGGRRGRISRG